MPFISPVIPVCTLLSTPPRVFSQVFIWPISFCCTPMMSAVHRLDLGVLDVVQDRLAHVDGALVVNDHHGEEGAVKRLALQGLQAAVHGGAVVHARHGHLGVGQGSEAQGQQQHEAFHGFSVGAPC